MWLKLPKGVESVSVEQQEFVPELTAEDGRGMICVPNHFADRLLDLGFDAALTPPGQEDVPKAITTSDFGTELSHLHRQLARVTTERDELRTRIVGLEAELRLRAAAPTPPPASTLSGPAGEILDALAGQVFGKD